MNRGAAEILKQYGIDLAAAQPQAADNAGTQTSEGAATPVYRPSGSESAASNVSGTGAPVEEAYEGQLGPTRAVDTYRAANRGPVLTVRDKPNSTTKSYEQQLEEARASGQWIGAGVNEPGLLQEFSKGGMTADQLYGRIQDLMAKREFGFDDAQIQLWRQQHSGEHPIKFINVGTGKPLTAMEVGDRFAAGNGSFVSQWHPDSYATLKNYAQHGLGAPVQQGPLYYDQDLFSAGQIKALSTLTGQSEDVIRWITNQARRPLSNLAGGYAQGALSTLGDMASGAGVLAKSLGAERLGGSLGSAGESARRFGESVGPTDPNSSLAKLGGALGSGSDYMLFGAMPGGQVVGGIAGSLAGGGRAYEEAKRAGADETTARLMALGGATIGAVQGLLGPSRMLSNAIERGVQGPLLRTVVTNALQQAALSGGSHVLENALAKLGYDPERGVFRGVGESALYGGIAGGIFGGVSHAAGSYLNPSLRDGESNSQRALPDPNKGPGDRLQVSWEPTPGETGGKLPGYWNDTPDWQLNYHREVSSAFLDHHGNDIIGRDLGLQVIGTEELPGEFGGKVSPGNQTLITVPPGDLSPGLRARIDAYAAMKGLVLRQDAVAWSRPRYVGDPAHEDLVSIDIGRRLSMDEAARMTNGLKEALGEGGAALVATPTGAWVLNVGKIDNPTFHQYAREVLASLVWDSPKEVARIGTFKNEGNYLENNWQENLQGEDYRSWIAASGSSGILRASESILTAKIAAIDAKYARERGWDKPGGPGGSGGGGAGGPVGRSAGLEPDSGPLGPQQASAPSSAGSSSGARPQGSGSPKREGDTSLDTDQPDGYGESNRFYQKSAAQAALNRLKTSLKQGGGRPSAGQLQDLRDVAGYHLEAGSREFGAWTRRMLDDVGEGSDPSFAGPAWTWDTC
jgi:hypothetical protein